MVLLILLFIAYQVFQIVLIPFFVGYLIWRSCAGKSVFGNGWERFGCVPKSLGKKTIWIHGVSVGEILAAARLIDEIKIHNPEVKVYVTTGTVGGYKVAQEQLRADVVSMLPFDFLIPMVMVFRRIKPSALIIIEGDFWPNFVMLARWLKVPIHILNARISQRSRSRIIRFGWLYRRLFDACRTILTQTKEDAQLFAVLGVSPDKVRYLGNIKSYNVEAKKIEAARTLKCNEQLTYHEKQIILLVGSVHPGELDGYLELLKACRKTHDGLKMILVPRHFHWKNELERKVAAAGFSFFMWDEKMHKKNSFNFDVKKIFTHHDVLLVCTLGILFSLYPLADIFYLGGTFVPIGGHNLLEPAVWGVPSFIGPYYQNTKDSADQLERVGALYKVETVEQLITQTCRLLDSPEQCKVAGLKAQKWLEAEVAQVECGLKNLIATL